MKVMLTIPAASPRKTLDGNLHEGGQVYTVLGSINGSQLRLSRVTDNAKLIILPSWMTRCSGKSKRKNCWKTKNMNAKIPCYFVTSITELEEILKQAKERGNLNFAIDFELDLDPAMVAANRFQLVQTKVVPV